MSVSEGNPEVVIRPVASGDLRQLARLIEYLAAHHGEISVASTDSLKRDLFGWSPCIRGHVAARGPLLIGYALYFPVYNAQRAERGMDLTHLFVLQEERGAGIGSQLIAAVRSEAKSHGCGFVAIGTHSENLPAQRYYERRFGAGAISGPKYRLSV